MKKLFLLVIPVMLLLSAAGCDNEVKPNKPPTLTISANQTSGTVPLTVVFSATATDPENRILTYEWDFGDGSTVSNEQSPMHTYTSVGSYTATCKVTDNGAPPQSVTESIEISVVNKIPTLTSISPSYKVSHMPAFTLTATGTDFVQGSKIIFNGEEKETTYISAGQLTCEIKPEDITPVSALSGSDGISSEIHETEISVQVRNPEPGGGDSNSASFWIMSNHSFRFIKNISNTSGFSNDPQIAVNDSGYIYTVWTDNIGNNEIFFSSSKDDGFTWDSPLNLSKDSVTSYKSSIAVDDSGNPVVVWVKLITSYEIFFTRSIDYGLRWLQFENVSDTKQFSSDPSIVADKEGNLYVSWWEGISSDSYAYFSHSTNKGLTWSKATIISHSTGQLSDPVLAIDETGNLYCAWYEYTGSKADIFFSMSTDSGINWSSPQNISNSTGQSDDPAIAADSSGNVYLVWRECVASTGCDIFFSHTVDDPSIWIQPINMSNQPLAAMRPEIAVDDAGNINVVWMNSIGYKYHDIYFSRSIDGGSTWSQYINISDHPFYSYNPAITVDKSGSLYIVWRDNRYGPMDILFTKSVY